MKRKNVVWSSHDVYMGDRRLVHECKSAARRLHDATRRVRHNTKRLLAAGRYDAAVDLVTVVISY